MKIIAIRHGETHWNVEGREMGQLDSSLTVLGKSQAGALARRLKAQPITKLYSSDLGRAVEISEIISSETNLSVNLNEGFRERHMGVFQGLTRSETKKKHPSASRDGGHTWWISNGIFRICSGFRARKWVEI